jgi:hypothetical protein
VINNNFLILLQLALLFSTKAIVSKLKKNILKVKFQQNEAAAEPGKAKAKGKDQSHNESRTNILDDSMRRDPVFSNVLNQDPEPALDMVRDKLDETKMSQYEKIIFKVDNYFNHSFFIYLLNSMLMDLFLTSLINVYFLEFASSVNILSNILSIFFIILYTAMIYNICKIMSSLERAKKDKIMSTHIKSKFKKWLFLRIPIKEDSSCWTSLIPEYLLVHEYFVCVFLVIFHRYGLLQLTSILAMKLLILFVLYQGPFKEKIDQWLITVNEMFFTAILLTMLLMMNSDVDTETKHKLYGMAIIGLYLMLMVYNVIIASISCYLEYKEAAEQRKKSKEKRVESGGLSKVIAKRNKQAALKLQKLKRIRAKPSTKVLDPKRSKPRTLKHGPNSKAIALSSNSIDLKKEQM